MASLKSQAFALKRIDLHDLEAMGTSYFWVLNNTNPRGHVNMTVADGMGNQVNVRMPITSIPIDLSTQATAKSLMASPHVRTMIAKSVIILVDPTAAREFLKTPEARSEHARLYDVGEIAAVGDESAAAGLATVQAEASGDLNPFAITMALAADLSEEEVLRELKLREDELNKGDFQYLAENSKHERVKAWAAEQAV